MASHVPQGYSWGRHRPKPLPFCGVDALATVALDLRPLLQTTVLMRLLYLQKGPSRVRRDAGCRVPFWTGNSGSKVHSLRTGLATAAGDAGAGLAGLMRQLATNLLRSPSAISGQPISGATTSPKRCSAVTRSPDRPAPEAPPFPHGWHRWVGTKQRAVQRHQLIDHLRVLRNPPRRPGTRSAAATPIEQGITDLAVGYGAPGTTNRMATEAWSTKTPGTSQMGIAAN